MTRLELILALWTAVHPSYAKRPGANKIAKAIVAAVEESGPVGEFGDEEGTIATISYYVLAESGVSETPYGFSWDAKTHVSCGILQEPCEFVHKHSLKAQLAWWIYSVRARGLASVDSSQERANKRKAKALELLDEIHGNSHDG